MIWLLLAACAVSAALGETADALAIGAIVVLNALVGFFQEYRAERAVLALRAMSAPRARVLRDGHSRLVPAAEVVPGDLLLLEAGDVVAADATRAGSPRAADHRVAADGRERSRREGRDADRRGDAPGGAARSGVPGHGGRRGPGRGRGRGHRHGHGDGPDRGPPGRRATTARRPCSSSSRRSGRTLLGLCLAIVAWSSAVGLSCAGGPGLEVFLSAVAARGGGGARGPAGRGHHRAGPGRAADGGAPRHRAAARRPWRPWAAPPSSAPTRRAPSRPGAWRSATRGARIDAQLLHAAAGCCDAELGEGGRSGRRRSHRDRAPAAAARTAASGAPTSSAAAPRRAETPFDSDAQADVGAARRRRPLRQGRTRGRAAALRSAGTEGALSREPGDGRARACASWPWRWAGEPRSGTCALLGLVGIADPPRPEAIAAVAQARGGGDPHRR